MSAGNKLGTFTRNWGSSAVYPGFTATGPPGTGRVWRLEKGSQRQWRGTIRTTNGQYGRMPLSLLKIINPTTQQLDMTQTTVRKVGSVPPSGNTSGFAYTATANSITWYWDGTNSSQVIVITRADGSKQTVPTSGSGLTVSGLSPSTTYYFLPFWTPGQSCNIGWVQGTTGSPQIAFVVADTTNAVTTQLYLMEQAFQGQEPLSSGFMTAATPASGTSGGGAGGGGRTGVCVMSGTDIIPLGSESYEIHVHSENNWLNIRTDDGKELNCTLDHPLYHAERGKVKAESLIRGDWIITADGERDVVEARRFQRVCSKWEIKMPQGHLYWANGILSHNIKQFTP